jgi:hypothetical protein
MFGFQFLQVKPEKVLRRLKDFELFCLGEKQMTPEHFQTLNEELSMSAVLHIGSRYYRKDIDGKHLIWRGHDSREHDLGRIDDLKIRNKGPGFHRITTNALAGDHVKKTDVIDLPKSNHHQITVVELKDGTNGIGPNYKTALRNAALKMHLKCAFEKANKSDVWKRYYGNC